MQGKREGERTVRCFVNMGNLGSYLGEEKEGAGKEGRGRGLSGVLLTWVT